MRFYSQVIFPRLMDFIMTSEILAPHRRRLLSHAEGHVLEIGFGTGVNLPHYPARVEKITAVDPNAGMNALAARRIEASPIAVETRGLTAEILPFPSRSFDTVVSTMTMCSIPSVSRALREVHRVLKPEGRFLFLEHGLSPDPKIRVWQNWLTPVSKLLGDGCHLNRDIRRLVEAQPFTTLALEQFYLQRIPKIAGYMYYGIATKVITAKGEVP